MSPKGTQPVKLPVVGAQVALKPWLVRLLSICSARPTQELAPARIRASAMEGFKPPRRKKFIKGALTQGLGLVPQGTEPVPTVNGLAGVWPAARAALKLATIKSPRMVLA